MTSVTMNMYGVFNISLWTLFVMAASGIWGEPLSTWFFIIPLLFSFMYAGAIYKVIGEK